MSSYENLSTIDKRAFLATLGLDIFNERKRLATELRQLLNERRPPRLKAKSIEASNWRSEA